MHSIHRVRARIARARRSSDVRVYPSFAVAFARVFNDAIARRRRCTKRVVAIVPRNPVPRATRDVDRRAGRSARAIDRAIRARPGRDAAARRENCRVEPRGDMRAVRRRPRRRATRGAVTTAPRRRPTTTTTARPTATIASTGTRRPARRAMGTRDRGCGKRRARDATVVDAGDGESARRSICAQCDRGFVRGGGFIRGGRARGDGGAAGRGSDADRGVFGAAPGEGGDGERDGGAGASDAVESGDAWTRGTTCWTSSARGGGRRGAR